MINRILVPLDGSALAETAIPYAQEMAEKYEAIVIFIRILEPLPIMADYGTYSINTYKADWSQQRSESEDYLHKVQQDMREKRIPTISMVLNIQAPADAIISTVEQENVDLVIMSTHGRSGLGKLVYGSVAEAVLHRATCPVFLIRGKQIQA